MAKVGEEVGKFRHVPGLAPIFGLGVADQFQELAAADGGPEEITCHLRQLMGLIDDEGIRPRQDLAEALVAQGDVSAQQVVVDDHQVRLLGATAGFQQGALIPVGAILAQAVVAGGGHRRPNGGIVRQGQFRDIAAPGRAGPVTHGQ